MTPESQKVLARIAHMEEVAFPEGANIEPIIRDLLALVERQKDALKIYIEIEYRGGKPANDALADTDATLARLGEGW